MKEMCKEWSTVIKELGVHDNISNTTKKFPIGTKLEWQRMKDTNSIQIYSDNYADVIVCDNFRIEGYVVRDKLVKQMAEEVKRCEDSFEITEPTEIQKEQIRKIMGQETETEIILDYLNNIDLSVVGPHVEQWIEQQKTKYRSRLDDIQFCNASDKEIIIKALNEYYSRFYKDNNPYKANKVLRVQKNYEETIEKGDIK